MIFLEKIFSVVNNSYCHIKVSQVVMKQRGVFWSHVRIQCDIELMSPVWRSTIKKRPRWPWPLPEIIWPKSASMAKLIIILSEVKFFYKGFKLSRSGLTEISTFLERVLIERRSIKIAYSLSYKPTFYVLLEFELLGLNYLRKTTAVINHD